MKNKTCLHKLLFIGLPAMALTFFMFLVPAPVHAESDFSKFVSFLEELEDVSGKKVDEIGFPVSTVEMRQSENFVNCLDGAGNDYEVAICFDNFSDSPLGKKLKEKGDIPSEVDMLLDCYILYRAGDNWGLAWKLTQVSACIVVHVLTGGVDVCGLLEDLYEMASDVYDKAKAVIAWLGDAGEDIVQAITDGYCWVVGCDDGTEVPPDVILFLRLQPYLNNALEERESIHENAYKTYLSDLKQRILTQANEEIKAFNEGKSVAIPSYTQDQMNAAAKQFTYNVNLLWTDDIIKRENQNRKNAVNNYLWVIKHFVQQVADNCANNTTCEAEYTFTPMCTDNINKNQKFVHIDRWKNDSSLSSIPGIEQLKKTVDKTSEVCLSFYLVNQKEYQKKARAYLVEQEICTESGPTLSCGDLEKYAACDRLMSAFGDQGACSVNLKAAADEARAKMMARFRKAGSKFYPLKFQSQSSDKTITKKSRGGTSIFVPEEFPCYRPTHEHFFKQFYTELFGDLPQKVLRAVLKKDAEYAALRDKVKKKVAQLNSNSEYADCNFDVSDIDPLLVEASSTYCLSLAKDNNDAPGFEFSTTKQSITIDGQYNPLMFTDMGGEMKKRFEKKKLPELVNQKIDITASMKRNQVAGKLNPTVKFAPAARLPGAGTVAVSPGQLQAPAVGQRVMSGTTLPGQQVAGTSLSSGIKAKKSPSVLKKKDVGIQKKAAMEILPISRRNTTSRPVTIRIKNVPFSRLPYELRYRKGRGGPYRAVRRPSHRFNRIGKLTTLTLDLKQPGQYQVRFKTSGRGAWGSWTGFTVTENIAHAAAPGHRLQVKPAASKMINPQPEPPGKTRQKHMTGHAGNIRPTTSVKLQPSGHIKPAPPTIKMPRNGQKFMLTGRNLHVKAEISHAQGQKVQVAVERETRDGFAALTSGIRIHRMKTKTTVDILVAGTGKYRLRVKNTGKNGRWGRWTTFTVNRIMKKSPKLHTARPTVQKTKQKAGSDSSPALGTRPHLQRIK